MHAKWLQKLSAKGKFDLNGKLTNAPTSGVDFAFDVAMHDCSLWDLGDNVSAITGLTGNLKLTPQSLTMVDLRGKRGDADVTGSGTSQLAHESATSSDRRGGQKSRARSAAVRHASRAGAKGLGCGSS